VTPATVARRQRQQSARTRGRVSGKKSGSPETGTPGRAGLAVLAGLRIGGVPETTASRTARKARAREAERRRQAVNALAIGECACRYAASQLANGLDPDGARELVLEMAGELTAVAAVLRRAAWLTVDQRRAQAILMAGRGMPTQQIADRLGVSDVTVRKYLRGRSPAKRRPGA
jgi:DNA-binding CsgD family transcriptional regulator